MTFARQPPLFDQGPRSMALLKLWNSLLGRQSEDPSPAEPSQAGQPVQSEQSISLKQSAGDAKAKSTAAVEPLKKTPAKKPASRTGLFGKTSPHAALLKLLRGSSVDSVLEISAGDGSRAVEVVALLAANKAKNSSLEGDENPKVRYSVIDQFEMGGGHHTLMEFHQTLRGAGIRPQVFPEIIDRGLMRVAYTVGSIDLILISEEAGEWATPEVLSLLSRVTHDHSLILFQKDNIWEKMSLSELGSEPVYRRAA